ncbi:MAG: hypothetical protein ABIR79_03090 [Candidatus Binatia bacterium]
MRSRAIGLAAVAVLSIIGSTPVVSHADPLTCEQAILKASSQLSQARIKALAKCEESKLKNKLAPGTDCATEPKTAPMLAKANAKLRATVATACGGRDKSCGTADDDVPAAIGWPLVCPDFEGAGCSNGIADCDDIADCLVCTHTRTVDQGVALYYEDLNPVPPGTDAQRCEIAIGKASIGFYAAKTKALTKCWAARYQGKHTAVCPVPGDGKAQAAIAKASLKMEAIIAKACTGVSLATVGFVPHCPSVVVPDGPACGGAVTNISDLIACVGCVTNYKVDCEVPLAVPTFQPYPAECVARPATPTATATSTGTATATRTATPMLTPTTTPTNTATTTPSPTATGGRTPTPTRTATATPTRTPTPTRTGTSTPTRTATVTPSPTATATPTCGNGVTELGENCDDGNILDCDACPSTCRTAPADCTASGTRAPQLVQLRLPAGGTLTSALFCLRYPTGVVGLPGTGNVPARLSGFSGQTTLSDFNNAARVALLGQNMLSQINVTVSFDLCAGQTAPPPTAFNCAVVSASNAGTSIAADMVECTPATP